MSDEAPGAAGELTQAGLISLLRDRLEPLPQYRSLWLTGSFGSGTEDQYSDVDTLMAVADDQFDLTLASWPDTAGRLTPVVYVKRLGQAPVFNVVLPGWLRWDVTLVRASEPHQLLRGRVRLVFEKDETQTVDPVPTSTNAVAALAVTEEFLRILGLLPVVVGRSDGVSVASGAGLLRQHLIGLMKVRAEEGTQYGALHLRRLLPVEDYRTLQALPALSADISSGVRLHRTLTEHFLPMARETLGGTYPTLLAETCLNHLNTQLGPGWGHN